MFSIVRRSSKTPAVEGKTVLCSKYSGRVFVADPDDVQRVCADFAKIPDKAELFEKMFIQLFIEEEVELAVYFGLEDKTEKELLKDPRFRAHVAKFQRFITAIMDLLSKGDRGDEIVEFMRIVGRQHGNVRSMSFTAEKWLIFKNVLISLLCRTSQENYSIWSRLMSFIIYEVKDAYLEHVREARSSSCPHIAELSIQQSRKFSENAVSSRPSPSASNGRSFLAP